MKNCGFSEEEAKSIEASYHEMYQVSDIWIQNHIKQACEDGYIITGFGLKVRTPVLANTIYSDNMPSLASAEARTAGNALGQGWGVLNDRARHETIQRIDDANLSKDILPIASIHDANYYLVKEDTGLITWLNQVVGEEASWQDHPIIAHDKVHLSGELGLFYPDWSNEITLPNNATEEEIISICSQS